MSEELSLLLAEIKRSQSIAATGPHGKIQLSDIIAGTRVEVKHNIPNDKPIINLTGYQDSTNLVGTAANGRLLIGEREQVKAMKKWISFKEQREKKEEERRKNNEAVIRQYKLKEKSNVSFLRNPAMAPVVSLEAFRQDKSKKKT